MQKAESRQLGYEGSEDAISRNLFISLDELSRLMTVEREGQGAMLIGCHPTTPSSVNTPILTRL